MLQQIEEPIIAEPCRCALAFARTSRETVDVMTQNIEELRDTLAQLHEQLESGDPAQGETRDLLQEALGEIQGALDRAGTGEQPSSDDDLTLRDRLSRMTEDFEEEHPKLAAAIGRVADALSNLGI